MKAALAVLAALAATAASAQGLTPHEAYTREVYRELIEIRTVHPDGDNTAAARAMARRLLDAGFDPKDVEVVEPHPLKGNLVARLRGTGGGKPVLLLAHLDVVEARREDWSPDLDPFKLTERDGYFYGRGSIDDKAMAAIFVANLVRAKREGWRPKRDVVVALTADEEGGGHNGVAWLLRNRRELIDAGVALNEGGGGRSRDGKPVQQSVQVAEKMFLSFDLEATSPGGHSSRPTAENAIYDLAASLERLSHHQFAARTGTGYDAGQRTTCVATRLEGGHADNALPQRAKALVNCRLLPDEDPAFVRSELQRMAGPRTTVTPRAEPRRSAPSDPASAWFAAIRRVSESMWPGVPVVAILGAGATDGSRLRNAGIPTYGTSGLFVDARENRLHGKDERLAVASFYEGLRYLDLLMRELANSE